MMVMVVNGIEPGIGRPTSQGSYLRTFAGPVVSHSYLESCAPRSDMDCSLGLRLPEGESISLLRNLASNSMSRMNCGT